jgi:hypothetical protein
MWVAFALALLLFAVAMALALWRLGPYDGAVARHQVDIVAVSLQT